MFETCSAVCEEMKDRMENLSAKDGCILKATSLLGAMLLGMVLAKGRRNWKPLIIFLLILAGGYFLLKLAVGDDCCCCCDDEDWDDEEEETKEDEE